MKALTLWQPWASMVAMGEKVIETRSWSTKYRGELAIHAAANLPGNRFGQGWLTTAFGNELADVLNCRRDFVIGEVNALPRGSILCIVKLHDVRAIDAFYRSTLDRREEVFGNYEDGRYAWEMEMVKRFDVPIPAKGNRMLWNWNEVPE